MDLTGKKILVIGAGVSGLGATRLLLQSGIEPLLFDENDKVTQAALKEKLNGGQPPLIMIGVLPQEVRLEVDLVILSPGVPADSPLVAEFKERGIPVWGEIELAARFSKGRLLAITGTNGKTTTTALLGAILRSVYPDVYVVGNIGNSYADIALRTTDDSIIVAELSSFQLETMVDTVPVVSAVLNITPDHLDRHHTMENYVQIKESIAKNQGPDGICVLNYEDAYTRAFGERCSADVFYYSSARKLEKGMYLEGDVIFLANGKGNVTQVMRTGEMKLLGIHNVENVMAAILMAYGFGVALETIVEAVKEFPGVEHRIEYVATKGGVDYYNDSKGTNPDAAIKAVAAMKKPTVLIGGGYDKHSEFDAWIEAFGGKVKYLILFGATAVRIKECALRHGFKNVRIVDDLTQAVRLSGELASQGDAVLLSPACASWDMFPNYEARGKLFKENVYELS